MRERSGTLIVCAIAGALLWVLLGAGGYSSACHDIARAQFAAEGRTRGIGDGTWDWADLVLRGAELHDQGRC